MPNRRRMATAAGFRNSPHGLSRGNAAWSSSSTSLPRRARSSAVTLPAGPAPTTMTSALLTLIRPSNADLDGTSAFRGGEGGVDHLHHPQAFLRLHQQLRALA